MFAMADWSRDDNGNSIRVLFIHWAESGFGKIPLKETLDQEFLGRMPPDLVIIAVPEPLESETLDLVRTQTVSSAFGRGKGKIGLTIITYSERGEFVRSKQENRLSKPGLKGSFFKNFWKRILISAGEKIARDEGVILISPGLRPFENPSGRRRDFFIKASNSLSKGNHIEILAVSLLKYLSRSIRKVYVDTNAIIPIVWSAVHQMKLWDTEERWPLPEVESFHSYDGLDDILPAPNEKEYFIVVSASSSGGMPIELKDKKNVSLDRQVILFGSQAYYHKDKKTKEKTSETIWDVSKLLAEKGVSPAVSDLGQNFVRLSGDDFAPQSDSTKSILISNKHAQLNKTLEIIQEIGNDRGNILFHRKVNPVDEPRFMRFEIGKIIRRKRLKRWMDIKAAPTIPRATKLLVYMGEGEKEKAASKSLANRIASKDMDVIDEKKFDSKSSELQDGDCVVAVCAVTYTGFELIACSRRMRTKKKINKHFIIGLAAMETKSSWLSLKSNLTKSPEGVKYTLENYHALFTGYIESNNIWRRKEREILQIANNNGFLGKGDWIPRRIAAINNSGDGLLDDDLFLKSANGENLIIREEFVFNRSKKTRPSIGSVMATIALVLQYARESEKLFINERITRDFFHNTVIDPETFSRYNDGAIQAAILRCAHQEELDYSQDIRHSQKMTSIIKDIFWSKNTTLGECALEFLCAVVCKKINLRKEDFDSLMEIIRDDTVFKNFI